MLSAEDNALVAHLGTILFYNVIQDGTAYVLYGNLQCRTRCPAIEHEMLSLRNLSRPVCDMLADDPVRFSRLFSARDASTERAFKQTAFSQVERVQGLAGGHAPAFRIDHSAICDRHDAAAASDEGLLDNHKRPTRRKTLAIYVAIRVCNHRSRLAGHGQCELGSSYAVHLFDLR